MIVKPPFLERHVAKWRNRSVIVGERVLGNIETPHTRMPNSWRGEGDLVSFLESGKHKAYKNEPTLMVN